MAKPPKRQLSEPEKIQLIALREGGENITELALAFGITKDAVKRVAGHIPKPAGGWSRRPKRTKLSEAQRQEINALISDITFTEIARLFGVTPVTLRRFLAQSRPKEGWGKRPKRKRTMTANDVMRARTMRIQGESLQAIADELHVSAQTIHRAVKNVAAEKTVWNKGHKLTKSQKAEAVARRINGETLSEIAAFYKVSIANIQYITQRAKPPEGWPIRHRKRTGK